MPTFFVTTVKPSGQGGDYNSLAAWEAGQQCDLTASNILVFSGSLNGTIGPWSTVALYSGTTNQVVSGVGFANAKGNQILVTGITSGFNYSSGLVWAYTGNTGNYFTIYNTGDSPISSAEIDGNWSGITPDNGVTINGWVSNPTNFIDVHTTTGAGHSGVWNPNSFYVTGAVSISETAVNISGVQFVDIYNNGNQIYVVPNNPTGQFYFDRLLVKGQITANGSSCGGMTFDVTGSYNAYVRNSIFYDIYYPSGGYFGIYVRNGGNVVASNCTFFNCNNGIGLNNKGSILYQNVLAQKCDAGFFGFVSLLSLPASTNNLSDDNTAPPFNTYYTGITVKFIDSGNRDLRLSPYDTGAMFKGSGISYAFTGDISRTFRGTGTVWDIGAHHPTGSFRTIKSAGGNYSSLNSWEAGESRDLTLVNKSAVAECYSMSDTTATVVNGWVTSAANTIKIYTPLSERHSGVWSTGKYSLVTSATTLTLSTPNITVDGLQLSGSAGGWGNIYNHYSGLTGNVTISNNILQGVVVPDSNYGGIYNDVIASSGILNVYNNLIYGWSGANAGLCGYSNAGHNTFTQSNLYNNLFHCKIGVALFLAPTLLNNNIFYQCNVDPNNNNALSGTDYNVTDATGIYYSVAGSTNTHDKVSQNFSFVNAANNDFRLSAYDTGAIFNGTSLSGIFTTDSIGTSRGTGTVWDVGPYHPTSYTKTILPSGQSGNYISLNAWQAGEQRDLTAVNKIANAEINGDWTSSPDYTQCVINGWTTNVSNYVNIYTTGTARHSGVWSDTKYRRDISGFYDLLIYTDFVRIDGLQSKLTTTGTNAGCCVGINHAVSTGAQIYYTNNIIRGNLSSTSYSAGVNPDTDYKGRFYLWNCIAYDFYSVTGTVMAAYALMDNTTGTAYVYNCTVYNSYRGFGVGLSSGNILKNCLARVCGDGFYGNGNAASDYNVTDSGSLFGSHSITGIPLFMNESSRDLRLSPYDTGVMFKGTGLSGIFTTDIAGNYRGTGNIWDVGASHPTTFIRTIKPSGQGAEYISLNAWQAGEQRNLQAVNKVAIAEIDGTWTGTSDTVGTTIAGWNSNNNNYVLVRAVNNARHSGIWDDNKYRYNYSTIVVQDVAYFSGLQFQKVISVNDFDGELSFQTPTYFLVDSCLIKGILSSTANSTYGLYCWNANNSSGVVRNSVFYNFYNGTGNVNPKGIFPNNCAITAYNTLFYNCYNGYYSNGGSAAINCLAQGCVDGFVNAFTNSSNNCSDISGDAPGTNSLSGTVTFLNAATGDFRLSPYDKYAILKGTGLSNLFQNDASGYFRGTGVIWDIGPLHSPTYTRTIKPSGQTGDYISLNAWQAGEQRDLTAVNKIANAEIRGSWTSPDTTATIVNGWTTSPTNTINIYTTGQARHSGYFDATKYLFSVSNTNGIDINPSYVYIDGLQLALTKTDTADNYKTVLTRAGTGEYVFKNCILSGNFNATTGTIFGIWIDLTARIDFYNLVGFGYNNTKPSDPFFSGTPIISYGGMGTRMMNCTLAQSDYGMTLWTTNDNFLYNNLVQNCKLSFHQSANTASTNNVSELGDGPGTNALSGVAQFINSGAGDYRLSPYDTGAILRGTGLYSIFTGDIAGTFRGTGNVWDVGAYHAPSYIRTIKQASGNYASLNAWQAGEQRDLVASNKIANAEIGGLWSAPESNLISMNGWTTDWTHYFNVYTTGQARHSGIITGSGNFTGYYRLENGASFGFTIYNYTDFSRFDGLAICASGAQTYALRSDAATYSQITNCIAYNSRNGFFIYLSTGYLNNCICQNGSGDASSVYDGTAFAAGGGGATQMYCDNCVAINNKYGFSCAGYRAIHVTNCYAGGNTSGDYFIDPNAQWTVTNSYSSDGTTGGVITLANAKFVNSTPWHEDLRLQQGSALIGIGSNLTGDPSWINPYKFTDISGAAWPTSGAWNVGPFAGFVIVSVPLDVWPISDVNTGNWTIPPLWSKINANNGDIDWISSPYSPTNETCEVMLSGITSPNTTTGHYVQYRFQKENGAGTNYNLRVGLYNGATLIASGVHTGIANGWITTGFTLTTGQASNITDYTNLRLRFTAYTG